MAPRCRSGYVTGKPIMFASTGEKLADFDTFHPDRMASRILGMGDMLTLIEQAEQHFEADQAEAMAAKMAGNDFTLEDFLQQMMMLRKMGPIGGLLGHAAGGRPDEGGAGERRRPGHRPDSGHHPVDDARPSGPNPRSSTPPAGSASPGAPVRRCPQVNALVDRFFEARKMMSSMAGRFGLPGGRPSNRKAAKGRKGKRSTGRGPTPPKVKGMPGGFPGLGALPPGMGGAGGMGGRSRAARGFGLDQLPPGFDPSQLKFPKK